MRIQVAFLIDDDVPDALRAKLEDFAKGAIEKAFQTHGGEIFFGGFAATPGTPPRDVAWGSQVSFFGPSRKRES